MVPVVVKSTGLKRAVLAAAGISSIGTLVHYSGLRSELGVIQAPPPAIPEVSVRHTARHLPADFRSTEAKQKEQQCVTTGL